MSARDLFKKWLEAEAAARPTDAAMLERVMRGRAGSWKWAAALVAAGSVALVATAVRTSRPNALPGDDPELLVYVNDVGAPEASAVVIHLQANPEQR